MFVIWCIYMDFYDIRRLIFPSDTFICIKACSAIQNTRFLCSLLPAGWWLIVLGAFDLFLDHSVCCLNVFSNGKGCTHKEWKRSSCTGKFLLHWKVVEEYRIELEESSWTMSYLTFITHKTQAAAWPSLVWCETLWATLTQRKLEVIIDC